MQSYTNLRSHPTYIARSWLQSPVPTGPEWSKNTTQAKQASQSVKNVMFLSWVFVKPPGVKGTLHCQSVILVWNKATVALKYGSKKHWWVNQRCSVINFSTVESCLVCFSYSYFLYNRAKIHYVHAALLPPHSFEAPPEIMNLEICWLSDNGLEYTVDVDE